MIPAIFPHKSTPNLTSYQRSFLVEDIEALALAPTAANEKGHQDVFALLAPRQVADQECGYKCSALAGRGGEAEVH